MRSAPRRPMRARRAGSGASPATAGARGPAPAAAEGGVPPPLAEGAEGLDEQVRLLDGREPADPAHDEAPAGADLRPDAVAERSGRVDAAGEVEAVRNHGEALRGRDLHGDEVVPNLLADRHESGRPAREDPLDRAEESGLRRREVAAEHVAVVGGG